MLYRKSLDHGNEIYQLVLPQKFRDRALRGIHEEVGHLGAERALTLARARFYWPKMAKAIEERCRTCERCFRRKASPQKAAPILDFYCTGLYHLLSHYAIIDCANKKKIFCLIA